MRTHVAECEQSKPKGNSDLQPNTLKWIPLKEPWLNLKEHSSDRIEKLGPFDWLEGSPTSRLRPPWNNLEAHFILSEHSVGWDIRPSLIVLCSFISVWEAVFNQVSHFPMASSMFRRFLTPLAFYSLRKPLPELRLFSLPLGLEDMVFSLVYIWREVFKADYLTTQLAWRS